MPIHESRQYRRGSIQGPGPRQRMTAAERGSWLFAVQRQHAAGGSIAAVARALAGALGEDGRLDPSYSRIAALARVSLRTVARALFRLKETGFLRWVNRVRGSEQTSNAYALCLPDPSAEPPSPSEAPPQPEVTHRPVSNLLPSKTDLAHNKERISPVQKEGSCASSIRRLVASLADRKQAVLRAWLQRPPRIGKPRIGVNREFAQGSRVAGFEHLSQSDVVISTHPHAQDPIAHGELPIDDNHRFGSVQRTGRQAGGDRDDEGRGGEDK